MRAAIDWIKRAAKFEFSTQSVGLLKLILKIVVVEIYCAIIVAMCYGNSNATMLLWHIYMQFVACVSCDVAFVALVMNALRPRTVRSRVFKFLLNFFFI